MEWLALRLFIYACDYKHSHYYYRKLYGVYAAPCTHSQYGTEKLTTVQKNLQLIVHTHGANKQGHYERTATHIYAREIWQKKRTTLGQLTKLQCFLFVCLNLKLHTHAHTPH